MERPETLLDALRRYAPTALPMHMPGHKRNAALSGAGGYLEALGATLDITEINGFDDLHDASGILKDAMARAAALWGSSRSWFCVNGSTGALLAAVRAALYPGDEAVCSRCCHRSVYNALELRGINVHFLYPEREPFTGTQCIVTPEAVASALDAHPNARAVILTSPSYEGVICDVEGICRVSHQRGAAVIVDEAHGAHLGFGAFPKGSVSCGADIVVQSLHKTLPCLTQTAIIHKNGVLVDERRIENALAVFETSSPSYLLMAAIDGCVELISREGEAIFSRWLGAISAFREKTASLKRLKIMSGEGAFAFDPSKIVIGTQNAAITGALLAQRLREEFSIELEMAAPQYAVAMTGAGDTEETLSRLASALCRIDATLAPSEALPLPCPDKAQRVCLPFEAEKADAEPVEAASAAGRVSAEYVWAYPPGVPIIIPGECVPEGFSELASAYEAAGIHLKSSFNALPDKIYVLKAPFYLDNGAE